jgi:flavin reductase (DIM6/NTAB) family NADH-FMN oxidoreductase RutF
VSWRTSASGIPRLDEDAFAVAECQVSSLLTVGDRAVVLGEVRHVEQVEGTPLLYVHRRFTSSPLTQLI